MEDLENSIFNEEYQADFNADNLDQKFERVT